MSYTQFHHLADELIEERREVLDVSAMLALLQNEPNNLLIFGFAER